MKVIQILRTNCAYKVLTLLTPFVETVILLHKQILFKLMSLHSQFPCCIQFHANSWHSNGMNINSQMQLRPKNLHNYKKKSTFFVF